jgi:hypothetical protein
MEATTAAHTAPRFSLVVPLILLCDLVVVCGCLVILFSVFRLPNR